MAAKCVRRNKVLKRKEPFLAEHKVLAISFPRGIYAQTADWAATDRLSWGQKKYVFSGHMGWYDRLESRGATNTWPAFPTGHLLSAGIDWELGA